MLSLGLIIFFNIKPINMFKLASTLTIGMSILTLLFTSCGVSNKSRSYDYDYLFITKQGIIQRPLIADMVVAKEKITLSRTYKNVTLVMAKQNIIEEFIKANNADLIVQPFYSSTTENASLKVTVQISLTGYPANYKNIRNYEPADKDYLLPASFFLGPVSYPERITTEKAEVVKKKR